MSFTIPTRKQPKIGRIRRGWGLTKSSWHVLKLDKELMALPLISFLVSIAILIPIGGAFVLEMLRITGGNFDSSSQNFPMPAWEVLLFGLAVYFVGAVISNFFSAAVIYGAVERFKGGNPTVRSSIAGARRKFRPLMMFSLMMATVGVILQSIEERVPFAGKIAVWLFEGAWAIANLFAIPVIVLSEEDIQPIEATKKSVAIIKKVWGESIVVNLGIGIIAFFSTFAYMLCVLVLTSLATTAGGSLFVAPLLLGLVGLVSLSLLFSVLSSVAKAALYQYATTGEAPGSFKRELLETSMSPKKARNIFA